MGAKERTKVGLPAKPLTLQNRGGNIFFFFYKLDLTKAGINHPW